MRIAPLGAALVLAGTASLPAVTAAQVAAGDVRGRLRSADAAYDAGDRARAEREYAAVVAIDPGQSRAVFRLAQLREGHDPRGALALYRRYVALEPGDAWGHLALANALATRGDVAGALEAHAHAVRLAPRDRDIRIARARILARAGRTDAAIGAYAAFVSESPGDAEAWRELAVQRRRAGQEGDALAALERARSLAPQGRDRDDVERDIARVRRAMRPTVEPLTGASRDSDGLSTVRAGASLIGPGAGAARLSGSAIVRRASDGTIARASQDVTVGVQLRPAAQLRLDVAGGFTRADRAFIDTLAVTQPTGPTPPGRGPRPPIGRAPAQGASSYSTFPVGRARIAWRQPGGAVAIDARVGRQLLDASPFLVAQGVLRDEAGATLDVRVAGPLRARAFGRVAAIHNEDERNARHLLGGAVAWVPGPYEVTLRAQAMRYDGPTALAYFAPRYVRTAELTTYTERELASGATVALDLGGGAQQVADWTAADGAWSPAVRGWLQVVSPLGESLSVGAEVEAYDSRVGVDAPSAVNPGSRWRYAAASVWLRIAFP